MVVCASRPGWCYSYVHREMHSPLPSPFPLYHATHKEPVPQKLQIYSFSPTQQKIYKIKIPIFGTLLISTQEYSKLILLSYPRKENEK